MQIPWRITRNTSIIYFLWFSLDAKIGLTLGKDLALVELGEETDPKISFFGPRRGFLPTFGCFQNILSLLSNSVNLVARCRSQIVQTLLSLPSNSVNLEGPLLEPEGHFPSGQLSAFGFAFK